MNNTQPITNMMHDQYVIIRFVSSGEESTP